MALSPYYVAGLIPGGGLFNPLTAAFVANGGVISDVFGPDKKLVFGQGSPYAELEELFQGRTGKTFDSSGHREYVRIFRVRMKTISEVSRINYHGPVAAAYCPGLPTPYAPYIPFRPEEWDPKALAVRIVAEQEHQDDSQCWKVTVYYSTEMPPWGPTLGSTLQPWIANGNQNQPWMLPPVREYDTETYTDYGPHDLRGIPYVDAAGRPLNPPPGRLQGDRVLTLTRNERFFETRDEDYVMVSNSVPFLGYPKGYAFCHGGRASPTWLGPTQFWRVVYKVYLRKKKSITVGGSGGLTTVTPAFNPQKVLNAGLYQKDLFYGYDIPIFSDSGPTVPIVKYGMQINAPVMLNDDGLEQSDMVTVPDANGNMVSFARPTYRYFQDYREVDLNQLLATGQ